MRVIEEINSSYIEQIAYDTYTRVCIVTINGSDHVYYDIGFLQFKSFITAESKGTFFNMYVKGRW